MNAIVELFGRSVHDRGLDTEWEQLIESQQCPFIHKTCYKVRKSDPSVSIGTCTVRHGRTAQPIVICPARLLAKDQIFTDCLHLLSSHEPGNELHVVPEVTIPGGSVDYFLVSARRGKVRDFAGIELQTLDTTGTVWPERQRLLASLKVRSDDDVTLMHRPFGMNWKMTAKTILMQLHHKIATFEHFNKHLALVTQDRLLHYMEKEFSFTHVSRPALSGDSMQFHSYTIESREGEYQLNLSSRWSTDTEGVAACLGLYAESRLGLAELVGMLESRIDSETVFAPLSGNPK